MPAPVEQGLRLYRGGFDFIGHFGEVWLLQDALASGLAAWRKGGD